MTEVLPALIAMNAHLKNIPVLLNSNSAIVRWVTQSELNNSHFEVERSNDGVHFEMRGKVLGNGSTSITHNYDFTDALNNNATIVYYRLRIIDNDGKYTFSKIVALKVNGSISVEKFNVFPNPFITDIKIALTSADETNAGFRILSLSATPTSKIDKLQSVIENLRCRTL